MKAERLRESGRLLNRAVTVALAALLTLAVALPSSASSDQTFQPEALGTPVPNFAGITGGNPPDPTGDVGPNHYVMAVNSSFSVYDKTGTQLLGATALNNLFAGANTVAAGNGICATRNDGDPIVVYDQLADRWLISQFSASGFDANNNPVAPFSICIAISRTANPAAAVNGNWFGYDFNVPAFPDYPKFGVWPDAYYMSSFEGANLGAFAFDRTNMLAGNAATFVRFRIGSLNSLRRTRLLPADWDGAQAPPAGAPNPFVRSVDGQTDDAPATTNDRLEVFNFAVNFATPANSTFGVGSVQATQTGGTPNQALATNAFDPDMCYPNGFPAMGPTVRDCIPQPNTTQRIDALSNRLMMQLKYRSFNAAGTDQRMVVNQTVDFNATDRGAIRWYELRNAGAGWAIFQQGDYSPDTDSRWMGSIAQDRDGNIAVGYSVASATTFPSLRYAGRVPTDAAGTLPQGEFALLNGTASQTNSNRWGDYSQMSVDPVDNCTFWYIGEFAPFSTQIGAFQFPSCNSDLELVSKVDGPDPAFAGENLTYTITARNNGPATALNAQIVDVLPPVVTYVSAIGSPCVQAPTGTLTCPLGTMAPGTSSTIVITVFIARDLVYNNGAPITITNTATVDAETEDSNPANDAKSASTLVKAKADLEIVSFNPVGPPAELAVGDSATVTLRKVIRNNGPSAPMDVRATKQASVSGTGTGTVSPAVHSDVVVGVGYLENRTHDETFVITCTGAGTLTFTFVNDISPNRPDDVDPNLANNRAVTSFTVSCLSFFLVLDEDAIDNTSGEPTPFTARDVNDDIARLAQRQELRYFHVRPLQQITLGSGQTGDEGWFAPKVIPAAWSTAGPTADGLRNYVGNPSQPYPHNVGPGLGRGGNPEALLDKVPLVTPLRATGLKQLIGRQVCAVVYDSDVSINYGPLNGSLKGENLGTVAFKVNSVVKRTGASSSSLPLVTLEISDADHVCEQGFRLFTGAPEPISSSQPLDVTP
jgi:uncharacterized repeat protein (TIGR01451 family)